MNILCITHADFETPGVIEDWARERRFGFKIEKPYRGEALSAVNTFDLLIVMGGPQSAVSMRDHPYLAGEVELIKATIAADKKVIGFCLGAQLIGIALGSQAERSPEKEVGVYPVALSAEGQNDPLLRGFPKSFPVIHWHNDMPGLTDDCAVLASSPGCPRQIVRYTRKAYGFQCHLEITTDGIRIMTEAVPDDLHPSRFTQSKAELLAQDYAPVNAMMRTILDRFTG